MANDPNKALRQAHEDGCRETYKAVYGYTSGGTVGDEKCSKRALAKFPKPKPELRVVANATCLGNSVRFNPETSQYEVFKGKSWYQLSAGGSCFNYDKLAAIAELRNTPYETEEE